MTRSAFTFILDSCAVDALLVMAPPCCWAERKHERVMRSLKQYLLVAGCLVAPLAFLGCATEKVPPPQGRHVSYRVKGESVTVVSAVTPFDSNPAAREAFVKWFKKGFEATLKGKEPMRVEWERNQIGQAGSRGYDVGLDEGERFRAEPKQSNQSLQTTPIPPF